VGTIVLSVVAGYLVGSFPTAYLFVRWKSRIDIRDAGSGNVGTLNSFQVSNSWLVGAAVLLIDLLKGAGAALLCARFSQESSLLAAIGGIGAVLGHNYPVWLSFRGGRGLAPGAGAMLVVCWPVVTAWLLLWTIGYALVRSVNPASAIGSGILMAACVLIPSAALRAIGIGPEPEIIRWFVVALMGIIVLRLVDPVKEYVATRRQSRAMSR
jgi:acyl phosphate:glycerol-3-phosphate acyltransferase